jgi:hypothetical protein
MKTTTLVLMLQLAGILHVGLMCAGMTMPRVVNLRAHIATLPLFVRQLFWVYYAFIGLCLVSFGTISFVFARELANGSGLARGLCLFLAVFWTVRLVAATFVFDVRPYIKSGLLLVGYHATSVVFVFLPIVYLLAAWKGGAR